jgi:hypothetical protein
LQHYSNPGHASERQPINKQHPMVQSTNLP